MEPVPALETRVLVRVLPRETPTQLTRPRDQVDSEPALPLKLHHHLAPLVVQSLPQGSVHLGVVAAPLLAVLLDNRARAKQARLTPPICLASLHPVLVHLALAEVFLEPNRRPLLAQQAVSAYHCHSLRSLR